MIGYSAENTDNIGGYAYTGGVGGFFDLNQAFVMAHIKDDKELIQKFDDIIAALREQKSKERQEVLDNLKKQLDSIPFILAEQNKPPFAMVPECQNGNLLNKHGEYVIKYAKNHGISIEEAHEAPMVKAHLECFNAMQDEMAKPNFLSGALSQSSKAVHDYYEHEYLRSATD